MSRQQILSQLLPCDDPAEFVSNYAGLLESSVSSKPSIDNVVSNYNRTIFWLINTFINTNSRAKSTLMTIKSSLAAAKNIDSNCVIRESGPELLQYSLDIFEKNLNAFNFENVQKFLNERKIRGSTQDRVSEIFHIIDGQIRTMNKSEQDVIFDKLGDLIDNYIWYEIIGE